jgi:hypothetical protein
MTDALFKIWIPVAITSYNVDSSGKYMHVHYSNRVINILRITETHMLTCYRPRMGLKRRARCWTTAQPRLFSYHGTIRINTVVSKNYDCLTKFTFKSTLYGVLHSENSQMDDIGPLILSAKTYMFWISKLDPLNLQNLVHRASPTLLI